MKWLIALPLELGRALLLLIAFVSAALGLAAWGAWLTPRLDFAANLAPFGLIAAVFCGLVWLAGRQPRKPLSTGPLALIAVVAWAGLIAPDLAHRLLARRAPAADETLKVVQFNLWEDDWNHTERKLAWLRKENPDVILLEEVNTAGFPLLGKLNAAYPYRVSCLPRPALCEVTILSKRPPLAEGRSLGKPDRPVYAWAQFQGPGGNYTIAATHVDWPLPDGRQPRRLDALAADLSALNAKDLILGGDFNASGWSRPLRRFDQRSGLVRQTHALPTYPAGQITRLKLPWPAPLLPIDQLYAAGAWRTVSLERGPDLGSDHYPLVAVFARDAPAAIPPAAKPPAAKPAAKNERAPSGTP